VAEFPSWTWSSLAGGRKPSRWKESARPVLALLLVYAERDCSRPFGLNGRAAWSNRMSGYWMARPSRRLVGRCYIRRQNPRTVIRGFCFCAVPAPWRVTRVRSVAECASKHSRAGKDIATAIRFLILPKIESCRRFAKNFWRSDGQASTVPSLLGCARSASPPGLGVS
jgi:hypothetical protein